VVLPCSRRRIASRPDERRTTTTEWGGTRGTHYPVARFVIQRFEGPDLSMEDDATGICERKLTAKPVAETQSRLVLENVFRAVIRDCDAKNRERSTSRLCRSRPEPIRRQDGVPREFHREDAKSAKKGGDLAHNPLTIRLIPSLISRF
jgi:hypothetical protein